MLKACANADGYLQVHIYICQYSEPFISKREMTTKGYSLL